MLTIDVDATSPKNVTPMTEDEARESVKRVKEGVNSIRGELLELHRRQGWMALGYSSWKEFAEQEFNLQRDSLYKMLDSAEVEANLASAGVDPYKILYTPDSQLRAIAKAPSTRQAAAFEQLKSWETEDGKVTEKEAEAAVCAVDPNYAHQLSTKIATKHIASGADIDPENLDELFKDTSPRLKQVLAEPVRELLKQGALRLPSVGSRATNTNATQKTEKSNATPDTGMTAAEIKEVRSHLQDFTPEQVGAIVSGMGSEYVAAILLAALPSLKPEEALAYFRQVELNSKQAQVIADAADELCQKLDAEFNS